MPSNYRRPNYWAVNQIGDKNLSFPNNKETLTVNAVTNTLGPRSVQTKRQADEQTHDLTRIQETGASLEGRLARELYIKGFRIWMEFNNLDLNPIIINVAVVHPKNDLYINPATLIRAYDLDLRYKDIQSTGTAPMLRSHGAINDDEYEVVMHKRYYLNGLAPNMSGSTNSFKTDNIYIPMNRVVTYQTGLPNSCNDKCVMAVWATRVNQPQLETDTTLATYGIYAVTVWNEIQ